MYQALEREIGALRYTGASWELPSIRALVKKYGASYVTVRNAVQRLSREGCIDVRQGRRSCLPGDRSRWGPGAASRLYKAIRDCIDDGRYRQGASLPKFQHLQSTHRVSSNTVIDALGMLRDEGVIHKSGKRWIVGAPALAASTAASGRSPAAISRKPVVLVVANHFATWYYVRFGNIHLPRFLLEFEHELRNSSIDIMPVFTNRIAGDQRIVNGREDIERLVNDLGPRYLGALFVGGPGSFVPTMNFWVNLLGEYGMPIAWLDAESAGEGIDQRTFPRLRGFYRCYWNDRQAAAIAVQVLAQLGHRRVGMPRMPEERSPRWQTRRIELARSSAGGCCPSMSIFSPVLAEDCWALEGRWWDSPGIAERIRSRGRSSREARVTQARDDLFALTPSMACLLREERVTALIAMNDDLAREFVCWLDSAGVEIPREVSVISFDNQEISRAYGISSIDFGLETLAYQAAHLLLGDVPVKTDDRWGNLGSRPALIARGTLGSI